MMNSSYVNIKKLYKGKRADTLGAFSHLSVLKLEISVSRRLGAGRVFINIFDDNSQCEKREELKVEKTELGVDFYSYTFNFKDLCTSDGNLFFWNVEFSLFEKTLFTNSINNVDFSFSENRDANRFKLLIYDEDFSTPDWAKSGVMYQIFVDRFCKEGKCVPVKSDAVLNLDWENGIPAYQKYVGEDIDNNMFFGGTLYGVCEKLDYLKKLGVSVLYLCPIFKAHSNHKYDTGDYESIDEMFGGKEAFDKLIKEASARNIRIILDGVFNHTGDDSKYFNKYGKYDSVGAFQSKDSPYYEWFNFEEHPEKYEAWWGIKILPRLRWNNEKINEYFLSENGIVRSWIKEGISGWRLDVADELSQEFIESLRDAAKSEKQDAFVIGEVWENASDKVSYGERRRYFRGKMLDSVMNYPVKTAIIDFIKNADANRFYNEITSIYSSYPPQVSALLMNILGTHDTERILTVLGDNFSPHISNDEKAHVRMGKDALQKAKKLLKIASVLQFTLPGIPSVYYGDEAGLEGYGDPFCRMPYPWGRQDNDLLSHYKTLCKIKRKEPSLHGASLEFLFAKEGFVVYRRENIYVLANLSDSVREFSLKKKSENLLSKEKEGKTVCVLPFGVKILKI